MVKAALSVNLANKSVGGSILSLAAFVFPQQFCSPSVITAACSATDRMLIGYCTFYPLNSNTLTPVLTIGPVSKNRLQNAFKRPKEKEQKTKWHKINKARL